MPGESSHLVVDYVLMKKREQERGLCMKTEIQFKKVLARSIGSP
jgi:hypothetical protein